MCIKNLDRDYWKAYTRRHCVSNWNNADYLLNDKTVTCHI